ncbi:MAG: DEAD/DEAH box helicase [Cytophagia bacterium]|nr:MAG: DEAD/DEAH box helicase [Runella sp.]TAG19702.1 MAG: DEAD/DEAH box helicase [Cytophagales bacterium]TAG38833.1 MAG: DEAD/DEAH box helicase [Cytophagia bacterium]TAG80487.1 MAG: DEAD/DEAH box helicase [Cytophagales bacterium]
MAQQRRSTFGQTWWGQQWIKVLEGLDQSGRLGRGRTYANNGSVASITFEGNKIEARVKGSQRTPYKTSFKIEPLSGSDKARLVSLIADNPLYLTQLLNRQLPPELYADCERKGIDLFPRSWKAFNSSCSCPDWGDPCKHRAAVLYLVANEIDKNPFLIFELRDFDLFKNLEALGFASADQKDVETLDVSDIRQLFEGGEEVDFKPDNTLYETLDFSTIPPLSEQLMSLLSDNPLFYRTGNFKQVSQKFYQETAKKAQALATTDEPRDQDYDKDLDSVESGDIIMDEALGFLQANFRDARERIVFQFDDLSKLINWIQHLPTAQLPQLSPTLKGLYFLNRFANKLLERGAIVPQLLRAKLKKEYHLVRWLPATLNEEVAAISAQIRAILPNELLYYKIGKRDIFAPIESDFLNALCSLILTERVRQFNDRFDYKATEIDNLFFRNEMTHFGSFETREIPNSVQLWLNKFFIAHRDFVPLLQVEDLDGVFKVNVLVENKKVELAAPIPLETFMDEREYAPVRMGVMRDLSMMAEHFPQLNQLIASKGTENLLFDSENFAEILFKILPTVRLFGIKIQLPKALQKLLRPQLTMTLDGEEDGKVAASSVISLENMLKFKWEVAVGDEHIDSQAFLKMVENYKGLVKIKDQYAYFDEKEIKTLLEKLKNPPALDGNDLLQTALTEEYNGTGVTLSKSAQKLMGDLLKNEAVALPENLYANLRPYQQRGYEWLYKNARLGMGSLIADDMGLGKTLQVIATLLKMKQEGAFKKTKGLVVVPTTLLTNWTKEIAKFAPELKPHLYHGPSRSLAQLNEADILLTTYGVVRSEEESLAKQKWTVMVIDEAQNIKNPNTAQTKAVKKMKAGIKIAMSGTPVENRMSEYWSIFDFANKGYLGSLKKFVSDYAIPIEIDRDQRKLDKFKRVTEPFILRRVKTDKKIIQDLPDKIEIDQACTLAQDQAALYQSVVEQALRGIDGQKDGFKRSGLIFKMMTALKQICNHPTHYLKKGGANPEASGKAMLLLDLLRQLLENGEKALIFTQYEEMGTLIQTMLQEQMQLEVPFLHGGVSRKKRDEMVEDFQNNRATRILILSLKAGGTGLNLVAANNVIHYDLWWNPAVEAQATDRAFRIGQTKNVMVHRFITQGSFEEKINKLIQNKRELANLTVTDGETWLGDLSNKDLRELVKLG